MGIPFDNHEWYVPGSTRNAGRVRARHSAAFRCLKADADGNCSAMLTTKKFAPLLLAGAAATAIAAAPVAFASPAFLPAGGPAGCYDPYGTGCAVTPPSPGVAGAIPGGPAGAAGPGGASGAIPGGPAGAAGPGGASGAIPGGPAGAAGPGGASGAIPGGPAGAAGPGGASGCVPGVGCASVPAP